LPEAVWQRCYVHFLRNALDQLPRKASDDCLQELRSIYDRHNLSEAQKNLTQWLDRWQKKYPKLCSWVEENIGETFNYCLFPVSEDRQRKLVLTHFW
jgi:putative transposase